MKGLILRLIETILEFYFIMVVNGLHDSPDVAKYFRVCQEDSLSPNLFLILISDLAEAYARRTITGLRPFLC